MGMILLRHKKKGHVIAAKKWDSADFYNMSKFTNQAIMEIKGEKNILLKTPVGYSKVIEGQYISHDENGNMYPLSTNTIKDYYDEVTVNQIEPKLKQLLESF